MKMNWALNAPIFFLIFSCSTTPQKKFQHLLSQNKCEEAALHLPNFSAQKATENFKSVAGTGASYILTGTAYGLDLVYYMAGGIVVPLAICSPFIIIPPEQVGSRVAGACMEAVHTQMGASDAFGNRNTFGEKMYEETRSWRCPDMTFAVDDLIKISDCYLRKEDKIKALKQLEVILDQKEFGGCIDQNEEGKVIEKIKAIQN